MYEKPAGEKGVRRARLCGKIARSSRWKATTTARRSRGNGGNGERTCGGGRRRGAFAPQIYAEKELSEGKLFVLPVAPPENPAKTLYVSINPKSEKEKLVSAFLSIAGMNRSCGE